MLQIATGSHSLLEERSPSARDVRHRVLARNAVLFWQDERQSQAIEIVEGTVRAARLWSDGSRQILAFFWPGDIIQAAALQRYTAEAVTRCVLRPRSHEEVGTFETSGTDQALQASICLLAATGKKSATSRMAWFLLQIYEHLPQDPRRANALRFTIPRNDVADYLGMSMETACRTLAAFRARGLIDLPTRKTICYRDMAQLARVAQSPKWEDAEA
ncbi:MAG: helix-turn-helix domain-containing protein [Proteobacteria bacterium]|nr:helix-turn-helix domain-containing protein [Pseudomonadota bacterium]